MAGSDNKVKDRRSSINTHKYSRLSAHLMYLALSATWRRVLPCRGCRRRERRICQPAAWLQRSQRRRPSARNARERYGELRNRRHVKGNNNHCPHSPFSHASSASSYVKETTRLFPLGSTVVDRGSGSLTAQASLSIDSCALLQFRRTPRDSALSRYRANGRSASLLHPLSAAWDVDRA